MSTPQILIIEDEHPYLHALTLKLKKTGYEVDGVDNGAEALELLKQKKYNLILLDMVMPDINGFTILEELKGEKIKTPIIVLTNLSQEEDRVKVTSYGVSEFLEKSDTSIIEVIKKVQTILE